MEFELKKGQALVIYGPQGSGKTILARKIAECYGSFIEIDAYQLKTRRDLNDLLGKGVSTVICDEIPEEIDVQSFLKLLITNGTALVEKKHGKPKIVSVPNFIFCTGNPSPLPGNDRRFWVVDASMVMAKA